MEMALSDSRIHSSSAFCKGRDHAAHLIYFSSSDECSRGDSTTNLQNFFLLSSVQII